MAKKNNEMTTIPLSKETRNRLAEFCGKKYESDRGNMTYDEGIRKLLKIALETEG